MFVKSLFELYKYELMLFVPVATDVTLSDEDKSAKASIFLSDVTRSMASQYIKDNAGFVDDGTLKFNIVTQLLTDGRVGRALQLPGNLWDNLDSLPEYTSATSYNTFVITVKNTDALRKEMATCCF